MRKKLFAELVGTFGLVFCGTVAIVIDQRSGGALGVAGIALVFGLIVGAMVKVFAPVSGAHINPAVTIALTVAGRSPRASLLPYVGAQLIGALLASLVVKALFPASEHLGATIPSGEPLVSFALELLLTLLLMLVILGSSGIPIIPPAISIGGIVGLEALLAGPISGASMNPARSLAPALVAGHFEHLWVYVAAPVLGALLAIPVGAVLFKGPKEAGR